jgi:hypothetical protein
LLSASNGFIPVAAIPVHAEPRAQRRNDHGMIRFNHFVHHAVRESLRVTPSDIPRLVPTTIEQWIFCQSIPNANNFLNKIRPRTGCCASYQAVASTTPCSTSGRNSTRHFIWRSENKVVFLFPSEEQRNRGVADSPQVAAPPGMPAQISDPLRNIQVDTHGVSKIAKKLAIRRLAAHFPAGSELD